MICHQCRQPIQRMPHGAWARCCDGMGYWIKGRPLPADRCGGERNGWTFCPSTKWWTR